MSTYEWFVLPLDTDTNRAISETWPLLTFYEAVSCDDGQSRGMWLMESHEQVGQLNASAKQRNLKFHVYNRAAPHLSARLWKFSGKKSAPKKQPTVVSVSVPF